MVPEFFLADALNSYLTSRYYLADIKRLGSNEWTLSHLQFAYDDGFLTSPTAGEATRLRLWDFVKIVRTTKLKEPPISVDELHSRSKSDWFIRSFALCQIIWFIIQLLLRAIQHLPSTALEISVLAFTFCSTITYGFNWHRPQDVEYPIVVHTLNVKQSRKENFESDIEPYRKEAGQVVLVASGAVFGAIHCLAWNVTFPTPEERLAWRICSMSTTGIALIMAFSIATAYIHEQWGTPTWFLFVLMTLYAIARLALITLAFMALRDLPAATYQTINWTNYFPHFGV